MKFLPLATLPMDGKPWHPVAIYGTAVSLLKIKYLIIMTILNSIFFAQFINSVEDLTDQLPPNAFYPLLAEGLKKCILCSSWLNGKQRDD